ncbi:MAG: hypothetical protein K0Q64_867 [Nitrobacter vulgaris]|nr:hypothetical protein [Nitrobacter vulgaris]
MKHLRLAKLSSAVLGLAYWLGPAGADPSLAQTARPEVIKTEYQYAAKVVCSLMLPHQDGTLAKGTYRTIVNMHNPGRKPLTIAAKVALSADFGSDPGPFSISPFKKAELAPDGAMKLSCFDIAGYFCPINGVCIDFAFLEGFVVIKSPEPLDVVSVYSARHTDGEVETMDVNAVQPRQMREAVEITPAEPKPVIKERKDYPSKESPAYGKDYSKKMCGGIANIPCPKGENCEDDPSDTCDPTKGGADCPGICVSDYSKQTCGGIASIPCPKGKKCVDDPSDTCDPAKGGADCSGICVSDHPKQTCGGIAGIPCPNEEKCVDDTSDTCDPAKGGADCPGNCVSEPTQKQLRP